jgi:hypothetical protein
MRLTIENKSLKKIVLNASLGWVDPVTTRVLEVTIAQLEAVRTRLVTLQSAGLIVFTTEASGNSDDDAAEGATVSIASSGGGGGVPTTRQIISGNGLTGGGDLSANRTLAVGAHADGSIVVGADTVQVGVLATDSQHGNRGGGALHSAAVAGGASGFMTGADKTKLDGVEAGADVTDAANVAAAGAVMTTRQVNTTAPLTGGGDLSANLSLGITAATTLAAGSMSAADKTKLDGIEAGADVTDATNVAAAGAVMTPAGGSDGDLLAKSGSTVVWTAPSGGGGSGATLRGIRITASGSYYERAIGHLLGGDAATGWETFAVVILDLVEGGGYGTREVISTTNEFVGPGYMIGVSDARPVHAITAGDGSRFGNFTGWWARGNQGKALAFLGLGFDQAASQRFAQLNGQDFFRGSMTGFSSAAATLPYRVGANAGTGTAPCLGMTILAIGHKQNGVLTDTQRQDIIRTFLTTGALPASVFTNLFNFSSLALGAAPATISDEIGAQDLTRVGTDIQVVDDFYASIAIRQTPEPDMIVTVGGATFTGRVILPSTTGAAVVVDGAEYVFSSTSGGAATVNLGTPTTGRRIVVKDNDGNAATNNITVSPGSGTIDGQPNHVINTNWGSVTFIGNGTNWRVIATI